MIVALKGLLCFLLPCTPVASWEWLNSAVGWLLDLHSAVG